MKQAPEYWYNNRLTPPLWARVAEKVFCLIAAQRRNFYSGDKIYRAPVPVIIVGNLSVGGSGKTPVVIWLVDTLRRAGYKPGVVSRGYGGKAPEYPLNVTVQTPVSHAGDEPVLIANRCHCPMVVDPKRSHAVQTLLAQNDVDIVISDDGLQHYALGRDIEIVVVDGERRFGNQHCLPAGPLREPLSRLKSVDYVINNGSAAEDEISMTLAMGDAHALQGGTQRKLSSFVHKRVHAVAGIGNPERFFRQLEQSGLNITRHPFPDHHDFSKEDLPFSDDIVMTEKDAVKCRSFAAENTWYVSVDAHMPQAFEERLLQHLSDIKQNSAE